MIKHSLSLRDPNSGDLVPGAAGDHLLNPSHDGYIVNGESYIWNGYLMLRSQKRPWNGTSPPGQYEYTTGMVMSMHKVHFNKGFLEMRAKLPKGDKVQIVTLFGLCEVDPGPKEILIGATIRAFLLKSSFT